MARKNPSRGRPSGNIFESVQIPGIPRNTFNRSCFHVTTFNMGELVPIHWFDTTPGDRSAMSLAHLLRFMPMQFPVLDRFEITFRAFAVPLRLLVPQDDYEQFITGGEDGKAVVPWPMHSMLRIAEYSNRSLHGGLTPVDDRSIVGSLADYLGWQTTDLEGSVASWDAFPDEPVSVLPFRAYQFIYNEWFRNQQLQDEVRWDRSMTTANDEVAQIVKLRHVNWRKDYFTSAMTEPQLGEDVFLPFGGHAPVWANEQVAGLYLYQNGGSEEMSRQGTLQYDSIDGVGVDSGQGPISIATKDNPDADGPAFYADMTDVVSTSINEFRRALAVQRWKELNARAGVRLPEWMLAHYHVRSSDARLQRPEYLGGLKASVSIGEVLQTSQSTTDSALGDMAGHGLSMGAGFLYNRFIEEQSIVMILVYVMPKESLYMTGMNRFWFKDDKFDFVDPLFAHLGEQEIWQGEISIDTINGADNPKNRFGYQSRYAEYKWSPNRVSGEMATTLKAWHMGRDFTGKPELTSTFITANPTHRIFDVESEQFHKLLLRVDFDHRYTTCLPYYGTPSIL